MSITVILLYVTVASGFLPLLAAAYNYSRLDRVLKIMAAFCVISVISDLAGLLTMHFKVIHNTYFIMHIFDIAAVLFFTAIYCQVFYKPLLKRVTLLLGSMSLLLMIINDLFIQVIHLFIINKRNSHSSPQHFFDIWFFEELAQAPDFVFAIIYFFCFSLFISK